jgi:hypothetical protein
MCLRSRVILLFVALVFTLPLIAVPATTVEAAPTVRQITITITELQLNRYLRTVKPRIATSIVADIIDGGIIIKLYTRWTDLPEYHEHYGVLIRDGKVVAEAGVFDIPGVGALGYADIKQLVPVLVPILDHNARVVNRFVVRQITSKAGSRYKAESVTTGNDKIVIVVNR